MPILQRNTIDSRLRAPCAPHKLHVVHILGLLAAGNAVLHWVMGHVKLFMEWVTIPVFIIALQLPQGAVLYWLASSLTALAQVRHRCRYSHRLVTVLAILVGA